ncbi:MAG: T9SS type A sorting domain-containing protein [candidate division Zixibacteria bacterium]|nr:T9SS type A sorting domain-containing protein [candidate division Zixibacteria bacterium]
MKRTILFFVICLLLRSSPFVLGDSLDFRVNDDVGKREQNYPAIAVNNQGRVVVVWRDYRDSTGNYDIFAQRFDSSGAKIKKNFKVNDDANLAQQIYPDVAMDGQGNFLIVWEDMRNEAQGDIYAQLYNSLDNKVGINFKVNEDIDQISQHDPSVAADGFGRYIVSWTDFREGSNDIYAQRLSSSAQFINDNFKVNDDLGNAQQHSSCVAMDYYGNFIIVWYDNMNGNDDIYAQRFDSSGTKIDTNFKVNQDQTTTSQRYPQVDMDNKGDFVIAWRDTRNGNEDIYFQRFGSDGLPIDTNLKVNTDASSSSQRNPSVAMDGWGDVVVAWQDERDSSGKGFDIYAQKYDNLGNADGSNYRINSDTLKAIQAYPKVATDGDYVYFTWVDGRAVANLDIYARFVPWLVNTSGEIALSSSSHNFGDVDSGTISNWEFRIHNIGKQSLTVDSIISTNSVFAAVNPSFPQAIPRDDSLIVTVRFSPLVGHFYQGNLFIYNSDPESPAVQVKLSGWGYPHTDEPDSFSLISPLKGARVHNLPLNLVWQKSFPADPDDSLTYTLWYGTDSSFSVKNEKSGIVDTQYVISDSLTEDAIYYWKVKAEDSFGLYIWSKEADWYWLVNLSNQPPKSFGLILPKDQDTLYTLLPTFVWHSSSDDDILDTVKYSLYYDTLSGFSTTQVISDISDTFYTLMDSLKEDRVYYWKVEAKDIAGAITLCNESSWSFTTPEGTGVREDEDEQMPNSPVLMQNYPNPFNSETRIIYFVNREGKVTVSVYNLLGQKIKEFNSYQSAGWKQISWDGKDQNGQPASSGVYFYELKTNQFRSIKKMTLVK